MSGGDAVIELGAAYSALDGEARARWGLSFGPRAAEKLIAGLDERDGLAPSANADRESVIAALARVRANDPLAVAALAAAVTTRETYFFRDEALLRALFTHVRALDANNPHGRVRLWSAGCATGEEAWSLAMIAYDALGESAIDRVTVIATDIVEEALEFAARGDYPPWSFRARTASPRHFDKSATGWRVRDALRPMLQFRTLNLASETMVGPSDVHAVVCCNVLMYLDAAARGRATELLARALHPEMGILYTSASEPVLESPLLRGPDLSNHCVAYRHARRGTSPRRAPSVPVHRTPIVRAAEPKRPTTIQRNRAATQQVLEALDAGEITRARAIATQLVERDRSSVMAHVLAAMTAQSAGAHDARRRHARIALALMESLADDSPVDDAHDELVGTLRALCKRLGATP